MKAVDQTKTWRKVEERLTRTTNPRHRRMLENLREHLQAEAAGDLERLLRTCAPDPNYHAWYMGVDSGLKGWDALVQYYTTLYEENRHVLEYDMERIVVDDDTIVTEGVFRQIYPGWVVRSRGVEVDDPDAAYLLTMRLVLIYPYDENGLMAGEDGYFDGPMWVKERLRKLDPDEIPEAYFAGLAAIGPSAGAAR